MKTTAVSIIMPTYNDAQYIAQAIASVQAQNFQQWELVIVNDASTDDTASKIAETASKDERIKIISHGQNLGLTQSLNDGLEAAQAEMIARLDSDDIWTDSGKLSAQLEFLSSNADHALVGTQGVAVDESGNELFKLQFPEDDGAIRQEILKHNCFIHSSVMFRAGVIRELGGYSNTEGYVEDYELWLQLGLRHKFAVLPMTAVQYRINPKGLTQTRTVPQWQAFINLMRKYRQHYPGFWTAYIKLQAQKTVLQLFGPKFLNTIKGIILRHG